jgi:hypothetical protein
MYFRYQHTRGSKEILREQYYHEFLQPSDAFRLRQLVDETVHCASEDFYLDIGVLAIGSTVDPSKITICDYPSTVALSYSDIDLFICPRRAVSFRQLYHIVHELAIIQDMSPKCVSNNKIRAMLDNQTRVDFHISPFNPPLTYAQQIRREIQCKNSFSILR